MAVLFAGTNTPVIYSSMLTIVSSSISFSRFSRNDGKVLSMSSLLSSPPRCSLGSCLNGGHSSWCTLYTGCGSATFSSGFTRPRRASSPLLSWALCALPRPLPLLPLQGQILLYVYLGEPGALQSYPSLSAPTAQSGNIVAVLCIHDLLKQFQITIKPCILKGLEVFSTSKTRFRSWLMESLDRLCLLFQRCAYAVHKLLAQLRQLRNFLVGLRHPDDSTHLSHYVFQFCIHDVGLAVPRRYSAYQRTGEDSQLFTAKEITRIGS